MTINGNLILSSSETARNSVESTSASVVESTPQSAERTSTSAESTSAAVQTTPVNKPSPETRSTGPSSVVKSPKALATSALPSTTQTQSSEQNTATTSLGDAQTTGGSGQQSTSVNGAASDSPAPDGNESAATRSPPTGSTANQATQPSNNPPSSAPGRSAGDVPSTDSPASSDGSEQQTAPADNAAPETTPIVSQLDSVIQQAAAPSASSEDTSKTSSTANIAAFIASGIGAIAASTTAAESSSADTAEDANSGKPGSATSPANTVLSLGSSAFTAFATQAQGTSAVIVAHAGSSATLQPGSLATLAGQIISAPSSGGIIVGKGSNAASAAFSAAASTQGSGSSPASTVLNIGSAAFTAVPTEIQGSSVVLVANRGSSATILAGSATTLAGELVSAPPSGGIIIGTGSNAATLGLLSGVPNIISATAIAEQAAGFPYSSVFTFGGQTMTALAARNGQDIVQVGSEPLTLSAGGSEITLGSQVISEASNGYIVAHSGSSAITLAIGDAPAASEQPGSTFTFGGQTLTAATGANGQDIVQVGSTTLTLSAGGPAVTLGSQVISEASDGRIIAQSGSSATTVVLGEGTTAAGELTLGSQTAGFTDIGSELVVGGQTLRPGSTNLFSGETLSLNSRTQVVVISGSHTSTQTLHATGVEGPGAKTASVTGHSISGAAISPTSITTSGAHKGSRRSISSLLALSLVLRWVLCMI